MLTLGNVYGIFSEVLLASAERYRVHTRRVAIDATINNIKLIYKEIFKLYFHTDVRATTEEIAANRLKFPTIISEISVQLSKMSPLVDGEVGQLVPLRAVTEIKAWLAEDSIARDDLLMFTGWEKASRAANYCVVRWWLFEMKDIDSTKHAQTVIAKLLETASFSPITFIGTNRLTERLKKAHEIANLKYNQLLSFLVELEENITLEHASNYQIADMALDYSARIVGKLREFGLSSVVDAYIAARDNPILSRGAAGKWDVGLERATEEKHKTTSALRSAGLGNAEVSCFIDSLLELNSASILESSSASMRLLLADQAVNISEFISTLRGNGLGRALCDILEKNLNAALLATAGVGIAKEDDDPQAVEVGHAARALHASVLRERTFVPLDDHLHPVQ